MIVHQTQVAWAAGWSWGLCDLLARIYVVQWQIWGKNRPVSSSLLMHVSWYLLAYEYVTLYITTYKSPWCNTSSLGSPGLWQEHNCTLDTPCYFQLSGVTSGAEYHNSHVLPVGGKKVLWNGLHSAQQPEVSSWIPHLPGTEGELKGGCLQKINAGLLLEGFLLPQLRSACAGRSLNCRYYCLSCLCDMDW